jgi:hypothetical protein
VRKAETCHPQRAMYLRRVCEARLAAPGDAWYSSDKAADRGLSYSTARSVRVRLAVRDKGE